MGFLGLFNAYAMRACLSITITEMVIPTDLTTTSIDDTCHEFQNTTLSNNSSITNVHKGNYDWNEYTQVTMKHLFFLVTNKIHLL
jgi:ACS family sodium-dependent inorganic phosphate cotransporter